MAGQIARADEVVRLDARTMRLLLELARRPGEVVSIQELLERVWAGVTVTPDSVYQAVASLRRILGDDPRRPRYIATAPRLGYRLVAEVSHQPDDIRRVAPPGRPAALAVGSGLMALAIFGALIAVGIRRAELAAEKQAQTRSVGVAPFLDLTPSMDQEELADDMTQGLADDLSRHPGLKTPGFRSSFYLIGKHVTLAQAATALGVAYVLDGSVRRSGDQVRVAARLVHGRDGLIVWSATYDRPLQEMPLVQSSVASAVAARLRSAPS